MKIITVESIAELLRRHGFGNFMLDLMRALKRDFARWESFTKMPRPAMHVPGGVLELMPICDNEQYYSYKYVNCHPKNPLTGKMTVVATGQLCRIDTGYPVMFSEMTVLTALRTGATAALATDHMARQNSHVLAIIGTGAQSEFQVKAMQSVRDIREVRFFDIDEDAMGKFGKNMSHAGIKLIPCTSSQQACLSADIITVCTACKAHVDVVNSAWLKNGVHINALGGDTIGKTELDIQILSQSKIVVEYFDQSFAEGEIQRFSVEEAKRFVFAELHELIVGKKKGRNNNHEITLFDSVGIALEDYSVLRLVYELAQRYGIGEEFCLTPDIANPKDLFSSVMC